MEELTTIQSKIYEIRGQRVMLDFDLVALYQVTTSAMNQAVKRNAERFPEEFMFRISASEWEHISSQFVTTSRTKRPKSSLPLAFTEQGVATLRTIAANIQINKRKQHATNGPQTGRGSIPGTKPDKNHGRMPVGGFQSGLPKRPGSEHINRCL